MQKSLVLIAGNKTGKKGHMAQDIADWADVKAGLIAAAHCITIIIVMLSQYHDIIVCTMITYVQNQSGMISDTCK